jgi:hypothetical protein
VDDANGRPHRPEGAEHAPGDRLMHVGDEATHAPDRLPGQLSRRLELGPLHQRREGVRVGAICITSAKCCSPGRRTHRRVRFQPAPYRRRRLSEIPSSRCATVSHASTARSIES